MEISLKINGIDKRVQIEPADMLLDVLRANGYKSVKKGCGSADCGVCTVLIDGKSVLSCSLFAAQADGKSVETVEGLVSRYPAQATGESELHPIQKAFLEEAAFQCGFCAPGLILSTKEVLEKFDHLNEQEIRYELSGNLCRCTGYENQVKAVKKLFEQKKAEV